MMLSMDYEQGPERRALLEREGAALFREVVEAGVLPVGDPRLDDAHPRGPVLALLIDLGLLRHDASVDGWVPVDPGSVQPGVVAPLGRRAVQLLEESSAWADTFTTLGQSFRRTPSSGSPLTEIRGIAAINRFLDSAVDDAEGELLTAQPAGPRRAVGLQLAVDRDIRALRRGVAMRTLYQHTARRSKQMREYVDVMRDQGAQVRTLDEFFNRLIIIDRRLALIPGETNETAVAIHDQYLVSYLADVFERSWERGRDYEGTTRTSETEVASEVRQLTVRMLTEGYSDTASAKRVGVSTRTYASYVAALKEEYGVETRFQLGLAMGSRGSEQTPENGSTPNPSAP